MTAMKEQPAGFSEKQRIVTYEINQILGTAYEQVYKKIVAKELEQSPLNNEDLRKACNKVKNMVALFIDKSKADLIEQKIKPYFKMLG